MRAERAGGKKGFATVVLAGAVLLAACGGGSGGESTGPLTAAQKGAKVYLRLCAICHGRDANGIPNLGKGLRNNPFVQGKTDAELVEFLKVGRPATDPLNITGVNMPPMGGDPSLTEEDLQNLVAFLRTL
jgi:disulfide bond formation protein DsbB